MRPTPPRPRPLVRRLAAFAVLTPLLLCASGLGSEEAAPAGAPAGAAQTDAADSATPELPASAAAALAAFREIDFREARDTLRLPEDAARTMLRAEWELCVAAREHADALVPLLSDEHRDVRAVAALAGGLSGSDAVRDALLERVEAETDPLALRRVVEALGRLGGDDALAAVEALQKRTRANEIKRVCATARRQLKGGAWDLESLRGEAAEALARNPLDAESTTAPDVGERAPELAAPSMDGVVNLSAHEGKVVVVGFAWGEDFREDDRVISRLVRRHTWFEGMDVEIVLVVPQEKERAESWQKRLRMPFTVAADPAGRAAAAYGVARRMLHDSEWKPAPAWFVIGRDGNVWWKRIGQKPGDHTSLGILEPAVESTYHGALPR